MGAPPTVRAANAPPNGRGSPRSDRARHRDPQVCVSGAEFGKTGEIGPPAAASDMTAPDRRDPVNGAVRRAR